MPAIEKRVVQFEVRKKLHDKLSVFAAEKGMHPNDYAKMLFEAGYSARCGVQSDPDLDAQVARALLLYADDVDSALIARAVGVPEARVMRILSAWREETKHGMEGAAA